MEVNKLNKNNFQRNFIFRFFVFLAVVLVTIGGGFAVTSGDVQIEGGDNYSTIQAAINAAQDGDTILVGPGVYDESFIVNKELNLIGTNNPVINGKIELNSNNIIIDGLKINGTDRGVEFYHNLDHITVRNSFISDTTTGIYINPTTANNITIFNNNITNTVAAIGGDSYEGISIIQNNLYNNQEGVGYSDSLSRNGPLLEDNNFSNNQIQVKDYSLSTIDMNAVFSNNIFDKAILTSDSILSSIQAAINAAQDGDTIFVGAGVYEENLNIPNNLNNLKLLGSNYGISSNSTRNQETIIKGYLRTGSGQSNWPNNFTFDGFSLLSNGDRAIIFRIQGDVNIKNNIIDQNESGQNQLYAIGFVAHSAGTNLLNLNFENNTLRNSRNGLYVDYTPTKGNIENNIFENIGSNPSFNEGSAIFSRSHINSINGNIFNNTGRGINFHPNHNTSTTVIDNLFEETNIYVRDNSGLIDLSSTFSNNQFAEQSIILDGNSIVPTTLVSIYNIDTNAGYSSIQNAINAANEGETILVEEGIYEETIDINVNNLTLISSSGAELTTIIGGSASSSASSATVRITTNNIILDGFTIDNLNNQAGSISGGNNAANVTIQNNIITNSQRGVRSDYYGKFGDSLMIYNNTFFELTRAITNTEDIPSLYVINNSFINININAVSFGSGIEDISIEGNSFENVGGRSITVWQDVVLSSGITLESILSSNLFDTSAGFSNGFNSEFIVVTSTISQAIVEAGDGDTILVGEGIYEESLTILKNLSLTSIEGASNTTIEGQVSFMSDNSKLDGFTVIGPDGDTRAIAPRSSINTTISNNIIENSRRAIQGDYNGVPTNLMIINNTLNTQFGVAGTEDMKGLVIEKNLFQTSVEGIELGDGVEFRNNVSVEELYDLNNWNLTGGFSIKDYREGGATIIGEGGSIEDILINTQENSSIILIKYNQTFNATIKNTSLVSNITFGSGLFINTSNYNKILVGEMNSVNVANELENSLNKYFKIEGLVSSSSGESQIKFPLSQLPNNLIESSITFKRFNETSDVWDIVPTFIDNGYIVANVTGFSLWGLSAQTQPTPPTGGGGGGGSWTTPIATEDEEEVEETPTTPVEEEDSQTGTGIDTTVEEEEEITQIEEDTTQDTSTGQDEQTTVDETTTETTVDEQAPGLGGFIAANAPTIAGVIAGLFIILAVVGYFIFGRS